MKIDPYTGEKFVPRRSNQRFANRENQICYNNQKASAERRRIRRELKPLLENQKILHKILYGLNEITVSRDYLLGAGFDFTASNGASRDGEKVCNHILSYQIRKAEEGYFHISRKEDE